MIFMENLVDNLYLIDICSDSLFCNIFNMKIWEILRNFIKNILRALIIVIIYLLLIWLIKTGGAVKYFHYLNTRDWEVLVKQIDLLHPQTIANVFYSQEELSWAMVEESHQIEKLPVLEPQIDLSVEVVQESGTNVYDPWFEEEFNQSIQEDLGLNWSWSADFGFVNNDL